MKKVAFKSAHQAFDGNGDRVLTRTNDEEFATDMPDPVSQNSYSEPPPETISGMAISLAFWLCLLLSAGLFATVALAPKYLVYMQLRGQFDTHQSRLAELEQEAEQIQRVIDAINRDPDFASELTRIEFDAIRPGEEVLPVDAELELDRRRIAAPLTTVSTAPPWYAPIVRYLAGDRTLRMSLLSVAALLVVISFTMLQPVGAEQVSSQLRNGNLMWRLVHNRYVRQI